MANEPKRQKYKDLIVTDDMQAIVSMCINNIEQYNPGRKPTYENSPQGLQAFKDKTVDYFKHIQFVNADDSIDKKLIVDIESWACFLGITRKTLSLYHNQRGKDWADFIDYVKENILTVKKEMGLNYRIPPMVYAFDLANNHGYFNTSEYKVTVESETQSIEAKQRQELEQSVADLGLIWNEEKGDYEAQ